MCEGETQRKRDSIEKRSRRRVIITENVLLSSWEKRRMIAITSESLESINNVFFTFSLPLYATHSFIVPICHSLGFILKWVNVYVIAVVYTHYNTVETSGQHPLAVAGAIGCV